MTNENQANNYYIIGFKNLNENYSFSDTFEIDFC